MASALAELGDPVDPGRLPALAEAVSEICPAAGRDPIYANRVLAQIGPEGLRRVLDVASDWGFELPEMSQALFCFASLLSTASWSAMFDPELLPALTRGAPRFLQELLGRSYPPHVTLELAAALLSTGEPEPHPESHRRWDVHHGLMAAVRLLVAGGVVERVTQPSGGGDPAVAFVTGA